MNNKWIILTEGYSGLTARTVEAVASAVSELAGYVVPIFFEDDISDSALGENNVILIGTPAFPRLDALIADGELDAPEASQGYSARLAASPYSQSHQLLAICGYDEAGTLYGAVDFVARYIGHDMHASSHMELMDRDYKSSHFRRKMPEWTRKSAPALERRGIWTWGRCIYNYRRFFSNMAALKLNQIVIWSDFVPLNARAVVEEAHSLGIEVYWGFSWGWDTHMGGFDVTDDAVLESWCAKILAKYENDYAPTGADGIYFQSFTETSNDTVGGVLIADIVVKWVNTIGGRLLARHPELELQFGLHASSVKTHLGSISRTDPRIRIVWEDAGAFPYAYMAKQIGGYDETLELNSRLCGLRGSDEKFGAVLKGLVCLDWNHFEHESGRFILGESSREFIASREREKAQIWRIIEPDWLKNLELARRLVAETARLTSGRRGTTLQWLIEDGCFEERIPLAAALAAELLWDAEADTSELLAAAAANPRVDSRQ